jgi:hypothetical protein
MSTLELSICHKALPKAIAQCQSKSSRAIQHILITFCFHNTLCTENLETKSAFENLTKSKANVQKNPATLSPHPMNPEHSETP